MYPDLLLQSCYNVKEILLTLQADMLSDKLWKCKHSKYISNDVVWFLQKISNIFDKGLVNFSTF